MNNSMGLILIFLVFTVGLSEYAFSKGYLEGDVDCVEISPPSCLNNHWFSTPIGIYLVDQNEVEHVAPQALIKMKKEIQDKGFVKVDSNSLWVNVIDVKLATGVAPLYGRVEPYILPIKNEYSTSVFKFSKKEEINSESYVFSISEDMSLKLKIIEFGVFDPAIPFPKILVNRTVSGLPGVYVSHADSINGRSVTTLQWANSSKMFILELHELARTEIDKNKLRLLQIAHEVSLINSVNTITYRHSIGF